MSKAVNILTALLGAYMSLRMFAEFQEALGTVFGISWGIIISTIVYLMYHIEKDDNAEIDVVSHVLEGVATNEEGDQHPLGFIIILYAIILVLFNAMLDFL